MTERTNTRRRFLAVSGSATLAAMAGCMDRVNSALSGAGSGDSNGNESGGGGSSEDDSYEPPALEVETEFKSREEFAQPGESFDDFEELDKWTVTQGNAEPDEDVALDGSQSLKLTAEDSENIVVQRSVENKDMSETELSVAVRTTTPGNIAISLRLVDIYGGHAHHQLRNVRYSNDEPGWFRTNPGVFEESEIPLERDQIDQVQLIVYNTGDAEVWVDDMRTHERPDKGYVILSWDDGTTNYYEEAAPLQDEFDMNVVMAAVRQWTRHDRDGIMTLDQLLERQDAGDQIVAHGTHQRFADLDEDGLRQALKRDKNWAVSNELEGGHYLVYPHNSFDQTVLDVAGDYYYAGGFNQSGNVNTTGVHGFDPLVLPRTIAHDLDISKRCVNLAAAHRNCTILNFHGFGEDNTMPKEDYRELLEHIDSKDDIEVIDFDDLWTMRREGH